MIGELTSFFAELTPLPPVHQLCFGNVKTIVGHPELTPKAVERLRRAFAPPAEPSPAAELPPPEEAAMMTTVQWGL